MLARNFCTLAATNASTGGQLSGFPSLRDIVLSAIHTYEEVDNRLDSHVFYPDLKFSCSGKITKLSFIGERREPAKDVSKYLRFSVWSTKANDTDFKLEKVKTKSLQFELGRFSILRNGSDNLSLYQIRLGKNDTFLFKDGDIFGIRQSDVNRSKVALLHQIGGGNSYSTELRSGVYHMRSFVKSILKKSNVVPLITIETGKQLACINAQYSLYCSATCSYIDPVNKVCPVLYFLQIKTLAARMAS